METNNSNNNIIHLTSITPIDGRYQNATNELKDYFSEYALIKYRLFIEIQYLLQLNTLDIFNYKLSPTDKDYINDIYTKFTKLEALKVKEIENKTQHDVKAIEYYIKEKIEKNEELKKNKIQNFIHFALTSQDINSSSYVLSIKQSIQKVINPNIYSIFNKLLNMSNLWIDVPILSRTHGQSATPSLLGKEILVFIERLDNQIETFKNIKYSTKFGGAVGNLNAHHFARGDIDWLCFVNGFVENRLNLKRNRYTTQIDHYDNYSEIFDCIKRINTIFIDLCQDIWTYISLNYFILKINTGEVGSSTMPHKVNPINFENAEGNLLLANNTLEFLSSKLPKSRLQRDLTDSTILRNLGVAFSYSLIGYKSLLKGLNKLDINEEKINKDLEDNYLVVTEGIQTKLKVLGFDNSYEIMKDITRVSQMNDNSQININIKIKDYINSLDISDADKYELLNITPNEYTGVIPTHCFYEKQFLKTTNI